MQIALHAAVLAAALSAPVTQYLPQPRSFEARMMEVAAPKNIEQIADKVAVAARRNPEWLKAYAQEHENIKPLPYHPNFGVTAEEYRSFVGGLDQLGLQETGVAKLRVEARADGGLAFVQGEGGDALKGVIIYPNKNFAQTPYGRLTERSDIDQSDPRSPTGRWKGVQWKMENLADGRVVRLALGRREAGDSIIYYYVRTPETRQTSILLYRD